MRKCFFTVLTVLFTASIVSCEPQELPVNPSETYGNGGDQDGNIDHEKDDMGN